jgi:hypothetical protein
MSHRITIPCNPANPVNYLACCGLFDLLARMDSGALGWWQTKAPVAFLLESEVAEPDLLATVLNTLSSVSCWKFVCPPGGSDPVRVVAEFAPPGKEVFAVALDWWLETSKLDGSILGKTAWKMFAGNMSVEKTTRDLIGAAANIAGRAGIPRCVAAFVAESAPLTCRFGFDFRSSRDGIDLGFITNDLKRKHTETFAIAELLALFGVQAFFPSRCDKPRRFASTRGWQGGDDGDGRAAFTYFLWDWPIPVTLARLAACRSLSETSQALCSRRKKRGELANLTPATTVAT